MRNFIFLEMERKESVLQKNIQSIPLCAFRNAIVAFKTVDLSIFLGEVATIEQSSLIRTLNWSRLFFSERFLDLLFDSSLSSPPSSGVSPSLNFHENCR